MDDTLDYLIQKIGDERTRIADTLVEGVSTDYAQYQFLCGQARGLLAAQSIINDLKTHLEQNDD